MAGFDDKSSNEVGNAENGQPTHQGPSNPAHNSDDIELQVIHRAPSDDKILANAAARDSDVATATAANNTLPSAVPPAIAWRLYVSHFLSTWNSRSFEFGSVLFLAAIYPNTLLWLSVYAVCRSAAGIILSTTIGKSIDRKARLLVVRFSIGESFQSTLMKRLGF
jgi:hypothetical protein